MTAFLTTIGGVLILVVLFFAAAIGLFIAGGLSRFNSPGVRVTAALLTLLVVGGPVAATWHERQTTERSNTDQLDQLRDYRRQVEDRMRRQAPPAPAPVAPVVAPTPELAV